MNVNKLRFGLKIPATHRGNWVKDIITLDYNLHGRTSSNTNRNKNGTKWSHRVGYDRVKNELYGMSFKGNSQLGCFSLRTLHYAYSTTTRVLLSRTI